LVQAHHSAGPTATLRYTRRMKWVTVLLAGALLQSPASRGPSSDDRPVVKLATHLVQVNVIVSDKQGQPVTGLTKDDFTIRDNGKPQAVRFFSVETNRVDAAPSEPLPPAVYTNRLQQRGEVPTALTAVLFDGLNTRVRDQIYAREQILKFLKQLTPNDRVAIYALGSRLRVLHDFSNDMNALLKSIGRQTRAGAELDASTVEEPDSGDQQLDAFLRESSERVAAFYTARRVQGTAEALVTIARHLAGRPGRKNLIWVSGGFPIQIGMESANLTAERRAFFQEIEAATRAVNQANIAIYPVDARGLIGVFEAMPSMDVANRGMSRQAAINANSRASQSIFNTQATMRELADRTGGRAFINNNDIAGAIRKAVDDSQVTYNIAFSPDHDQWDGKFHEIKVKVNRSRLEVRHRKGYVAFQERDKQDDQKARVADVTLAAASPLEATGLSLTVQKLASSPQLSLQMQVDPREVDFQPKEGRWAAGLDVMVALRNAQGAVLGTFSRTAGFNLRQETYDSVLKNGLSVSMQCDLQPGATKARVVVRDMATGQIGSVDVLLN